MPGPYRSNPSFRTGFVRLGALGLALNAVVWWNSLYIDAAGLRAFHDGGSPA
ncbi:hypothetical protein [Streptosporangium canum]|uniref:hypothetical protein n=1 Tax=Streptosporangium canum TaxID=324952 RepID=UPI0033ACE461